MKLKKIASLMLAGVMAVSMLAGCSGNSNSNNNNNEDPVVDSSLAGQVIAALDKDTTDVVAFAGDDSMESALKKMVEDYGTAITSVNNVETLTKALLLVNDSLGEYGGLPAVYTGNTYGNTSEATDKKEETSVWVRVFDAPGADSSFVANKLADMIDDNAVAWSWTAGGMNGDVNCADLPDQSKTYTDKDGEYWYNFDYTGKIAVVEGDSAITGQNFYVIAYSVTRTPTQVYKANV